MKKLLALIIVLNSFTMLSQQKTIFQEYRDKHPKFIDTTKVRKDVVITDELIYLRKCLSASHSEYKTGSTLLISGIALSGLGIYLSTKNTNALPVVYIGSAICVLGEIFMIDSHKWIGRAGIGVGGNGVLITYKLK